MIKPPSKPKPTDFVPARSGSRLADLWLKLEQAEARALAAWHRYNDRFNAHPEERQLVRDHRDAE